MGTKSVARAGVLVGKSVFVTALFVSCTLVSLDAQESSSLADAAKHLDVMVMTVTEYEPATLAMLVTASDAIIVGTVTAGRPFLLHDHILTDYDVSVDRVIRRTQPPGRAAGDVVVVRRYVGAMTVEGHTIAGGENDFPPFTIGGRYVLFLTGRDADPHYRVNYGPQGTFAATNGLVRPTSEAFVWWNRERTVVTLDRFLQEILKIAPPRP